jgi:NADPH:quinone reductase-like Zn-dependent oxidoreductase
MARTITFHETGGPEVLRYENRPVRSPGEGEVRIRVDAIGLNRAEVNFRRGTYLEQPVFPAGLGSEAAGEVLEVGPGVERWSVGDVISVVPAFSQNDYPVYAEEAVVPAAALVPRPNGMDAINGAAIWMPYVTVYGMVQEIVRVRRGDPGNACSRSSRNVRKNRSTGPLSRPVRSQAGWMEIPSR